MTISSLGDWVGFTAVVALVTRLASSSDTAALGAVAARHDGAHAARDPVRPVRRRVGRPPRPAQDHDRRRHRPRHDVRADAVPPLGLPDPRALVLHRVPVAAVDAGARREPAEPGAAPPAGERELARAAELLRHAAARRRRGPRAGDRLDGDRATDPLLPHAHRVAGAVAGRGHVRVLRVHGLGGAASRPDRHRRRAAGPEEGLDRHEGRASASCSRTRSRARWRRASSRRSWRPARCSRSGRRSPPTRSAPGRPGGRSS